jgi:hypothetical protein
MILLVILRQAKGRDYWWFVVGWLMILKECEGNIDMRNFECGWGTLWIK